MSREGRANSPDEPRCTHPALFLGLTASQSSALHGFFSDGVATKFLEGRALRDREETTRPKIVLGFPAHRTGFRKESEARLVLLVWLCCVVCYGAATRANGEVK
jgi:hypothetical protein